MGFILNKHIGKVIGVKSLSSPASLVLMWTKLKWLILPRKESLKSYLLSILLTPLLVRVFFLACVEKKIPPKRLLGISFSRFTVSAKV